MKNQSVFIQLLKKIKKMKFKDWNALFLLFLTFLPGKIIKMLEPNIWIVSEYAMMARDNGYWFYKYIKENHPAIKAYYPISSESPDFEKIKNIGGAIKFGGFFHYCMFWAANIYCSSGSVQGFPYPRICEDLVLHNFHRFKYIFLNHGITRGYSNIVNGKTTNYDVLCTCSELDKKVIIEENNQTDNVVAVTGYARHDNLNDELLEQSLILVMPTWREWLSYRNAESEEEVARVKDSFLNSKYYQYYNDLLNNKLLATFLTINNLQMVFYLHQYAQPYSSYFSTTSDRIEIGTSNRFDVQTLLKKAALLITDYSSVCYDFAYMYKPVLYYQFDIEEFENKQYAPGNLYSYSENGLGDVCYTFEDLMDKIESLYGRGLVMPKRYRERVLDYFKYHDTDNCRRIFDHISRIVGER